MQLDTRPVLIGFLIGLICLIFGIFWAVYITVNHEQIHKTLAERAMAGVAEKFITGGSHDHGAMEEGMGDMKGHGVHEHGGAVHDHSMDPMDMKEAPSKGKTPRVHENATHHDDAGASMGPGQKQASDHAGMEEKMDHMLHHDPLMEEAHERIRRGHVHEMGLGLLTIALSFVLAAIKAPPFIKTVTSAAVGVGSFIYPFSWIIMGYRTTAMGMSASQESVVPIVIISMPLVLLGLFVTLLFVLLTAVKK